MRSIFTSLILVLAICAFLFPVGASASINLAGAALLDEGRVVYFGLDDKGEPGVYSIDAQSGAIIRLYDADAFLLAASDGYTLLSVPDEAGEYQTLLVDREGKTVFSGNFTAASAIYANGSFFADRYQISPINGEISSRELLGANAFPITVNGDYLYFYDGSRYESVSAMEDGKSVYSLCRVNLATGLSQVLTGEGATLISADSDGIVYVMDDFYILENGDTRLVSVERGVYKADADGKNALKLCDVASYEKSVYELFDCYIDGVIYGVYYDYESPEPIPPMTLKRVTIHGETLEDIPVDFGTLVGVRNGTAYICAPRYTENYEYLCDDIIAFDLLSGERTAMCEDRNLILQYFDGPPQIALDGERIFFTALEKGDEYISLWSMTVRADSLEKIANLYCVG